MADKQFERRLELHETLCGILGSRNAYFQPPENVKINYPAIVYCLADIQNTYADNGIYLSGRKYKLTVIDKNPDSEIVTKTAMLPRCEFNTYYTQSNMNYTVFTINW